MIIKLAEAKVRVQDIKSTATEHDDPEILALFKKTAADLKAIAPKAKDFLYFTCIMMHAAEAATLNDDGSFKKTYGGQNVTSEWEKRGDAYIWHCSDPNIMPYKNANCFVPGTEILLSDGTVKNIEDIEVGDEVITHKGNKKKVLHLSVTDYSGTIIDLHIRNGRVVSVTPDHPFYRLTVSNSEGKLDTPKHLLRVASNSKNFEFVKVKDLSKYDLLTTPVISSDCSNELTSDQAHLLGLFAAEGCYTKKYNRDQGVNLTFSVHEEKTLVPETCKLISTVFPEASVKVNVMADRSICRVTVTGEGVAKFFRQHVGEYSVHKSLSPQLVFNSDADIKKQFIVGWLEGDGHVEKQHGQIIGVTVSKNMVNQISTMLHSVGIHHSVRKTDCTNSVFHSEKYGDYQKHDAYRIEIPSTFGSDLIKDSTKLNFINKPSDRNINAYHGGYHLKSVSGIVEKDYNGPVYNFQVEDDNSYIANGVAVHNCDIFPEFELKTAHKRWVGKPLCLDHQSSSVDKIRGIIVDTVYDDKHKRVIALCALDKVNYPDLARKVESGYSHDVSMGTAVATAICTEKGCHRVARTEADFCDHMRKKSGYGEINVGLNPIELSLVVNGADPKAKVRRVIAAANSIASYIEMKKTATLSEKEVKDLRDRIKNMESELSEIKDVLEPDNNNTSTSDAPYGQEGRGSLQMAETQLNNQDQTFNLPQRFASDVISSIKSLEQKVSGFNSFISKLAVKQTSEENSMTSKKQAYFLGGGGVNEPTPGKAKYPSENYTKVRDSEDKQMVGETPFPGVGSQDDMYPGDKELKQKLLRADVEARQMRRAAVLEKAKQTLKNKNAYILGTEDPTTYKADPLNEKLREKEDKQMVGAKPFPGVGAVDGLYGDDLKTKELLNRADTKLSARFVKASNDRGLDDLSNSRWDIFAKNSSGARLVLSATVKELAGSDSKVPSLYSAIATEKYGSEIIKTIRAQGLPMARSIFKGAQTAPAAAGAGQAPAAPASSGGPAPAAPSSGAPAPGPTPSADADAGEPADAGAGEGTPIDKVESIANEIDSLIAELHKAVKELKQEDTDDLDALAPEGGPEGAAGGPGVPAVAGVSLPQMRKTLNVALQKGMKQAAAEMNEASEELRLIASVYNNSSAFNSSDSALTRQIVRDAVGEARSSIKNAKMTMAAFVKYAHGTNALLRKVAEYGPSDETIFNPTSRTPHGGQFDPNKGTRPVPTLSTSDAYKKFTAPSAAVRRGPSGPNRPNAGQFSTEKPAAPANKKPPFPGAKITDPNDPLYGSMADDDDFEDDDLQELGGSGAWGEEDPFDKDEEGEEVDLDNLDEDEDEGDDFDAEEPDLDEDEAEESDEDDDDVDNDDEDDMGDNESVKKAMRRLSRALRVNADISGGPSKDYKDDQPQMPGSSSNPGATADLKTPKGFGFGTKTPKAPEPPKSGEARADDGADKPVTDEDLRESAKALCSMQPDTDNSTCVEDTYKDLKDAKDKGVRVTPKVPKQSLRRILVSKFGSKVANRVVRTLNKLAEGGTDNPLGTKGSGTETDPFVVDTKEELPWGAKLVKTIPNKGDLYKVDDPTNPTWWLLAVQAQAPAMASLDALRTKVAQKGLQFSDMLKNHPKSNRTKLDIKPANNADVVETLEETHQAMMDIALAAPKVRKDAESIQKLVIAGEIDPGTDFPGLIAKGLDSAAVSYWKKFYGEGDAESKNFATELTKAYKEKKAGEEVESFKVKLARAYELSNEMVRRGMLSDTKEAIAEQVQSLTKCSDEQFNNFKGMVTRYNMKKQASIPEVGVQETILSSSNVTPAAQANVTLVDEFAAAFRGRKF